MSDNKKKIFVCFMILAVAFFLIFCGYQLIQAQQAQNHEEAREAQSG